MGQVLAGHDQESGSPAVAFVFARADLNDTDRAWFVARSLEPSRAVRSPTIIETRMSPQPLVAVAWSPAEMGAAGGALPSRIGDIIGWFGSLADAGPEVGIAHVLGALDRLEPKGAPGTMVLDGAPRIAAPLPPAARPAPPAPPSEAAVAAQDPEPAAQAALAIPPTKALPNAELSEAIAEWKARGRAPSQPGPERMRTPTPAPDDGASRRRARTLPGQARPSARLPILLTIAAAATVALIAVGWAALSAHSTAPPPTPQVVPMAPPEPSPAIPPSQEALPAPPPTTASADPAAAPAAEATPPPPEAPSPPAEELVLETTPEGADVCDVKSGKRIGRTPLTLPADKFHRGRKLFLTAPGHRALEVPWPPRKVYRLVPLGADEAQSLSPCAF